MNPSRGTRHAWSVLLAITTPLGASTMPCAAFAQVLITEVQPNPTGDDTSEWLEIQNVGPEEASIADYVVHDFGPASPRLYAFPPGTHLAPGQVIVVARAATAFSVMAEGDGFVKTTADFELAEGGSDDPSVPNLIVVGGQTALQLANNGDAVVLLDERGVVVSGVEWGIDRVEVPGSPLVPVPGSGESLARISSSGDSAADFVILSRPTPGEGVEGVDVPALAVERVQLSAQALVHGQPTAWEVAVTNPSDVAGVSLHAALAASPEGPALDAYVATPLAGDGPTYQVEGSLASLLGGVEVLAPATFHALYLRYYARALGRSGQVATRPAGAGPGVENAAFLWENILPPDHVTSIAEVRAQEAEGRPRYLHHAVRVEGIVTTSHEAFAAQRTNFFIVSLDGEDAIRIHDPSLDVIDPASGRTKVEPGDHVLVSGRVGQFFGLRQIGEDQRVRASATQVRLLGQRTPPGPRTLSIAALLQDPERFESQLVKIEGAWLAPDAASPSGTPETWPVDGNLGIEDATGSLAVRVARSTDLAGAPTPDGAFDIAGIFGQYSPDGVGGYQLLPRSREDIAPLAPSADAGVGDAGDGSDAEVEADAGEGQDGGIDGGVGDDGGSGLDAEVEADAGDTTADASRPRPDGSTSDAALGLDGGPVPIPGDSGVLAARTDAGAGAGDSEGPRQVWGTESEGDPSGGCGCKAVGNRPHPSKASKRSVPFALGFLTILLVTRRRLRRHTLPLQPEQTPGARPAA